MHGAMQPVFIGLFSGGVGDVREIALRECPSLPVDVGPGMPKSLQQTHGAHKQVSIELGRTMFANPLSLPLSRCDVGMQGCN